MRSSERGIAKKAARAKVSESDESTDLQALLETKTTVAAGKGAGAVSKDVGSAVEGAGVTDQLSMTGLESKAKRRSAVSEIKMEAAAVPKPAAEAPAAPVEMSKESEREQKTHRFSLKDKVVIFNFFVEEMETEDEMPYGIRIQGMEKDSSTIMLVCTVSRSLFDLDNKNLKIASVDMGKIVLEINGNYRFIIDINI